VLLKNTEKTKVLGKIKKVISFIFLMIIFMNHLTSLLHAFEHKNNSQITSFKAVNFNQDFDFTKSCFYCDTYFNLEYTQHDFLAYSLTVPDSISACILDREKQLLSIVIHRKKSRSPPSLNS